MNKWLLGLLTWVSVQANASAPRLALDVVDTTLANGMRVLLLENKQSPLVACRVFYATGSVHEAPGRAGLAHMLEHMLFKGTRKVGIRDWQQDSVYQAQISALSPNYHQAQAKGDTLEAKKLRAQLDSILELQRQGFIKDELWTAYQDAGGTGLNAFTTDLATAYFVTLPKEKVELFYWLESDRMQNAVLREFLPERDVVREERRMRYDDSPYGRYFETLSATFYEAHPYRIPTIGWPSDIEALTQAAAEEHYRKYYKPRNAVLILVGDFDPRVQLKKITQYFDPIPAGEDLPPMLAREPVQVAAKTITQYKESAKPRMDLLFPSPAVGTPDAYALDVLAGALGGKSGRLYKQLVATGLALGVDADHHAQPDMGTFSFEVELNPAVDPKKIEAEIWSAIQWAQDSLLTARELQKVQNNTTMAFLDGFGDLDNMANQLGFFELYGSWKMLRDYPAQLAQVSPEQVREAARKYLKYEQSTTGWMLPEKLRPFGRSVAKESK